MKLIDRILLGLFKRLWSSNNIVGIYLYRFAQWLISSVAPYVPPRAEIPSERANAFVKVAVQSSTIPDAGLGLFSLERVDAGVTIGEYTGDVIDSAFNVVRLRNIDYVASTGGASWVDAIHRPEVKMRYICHHPKKEKRNVQFRDEGSRKFVETIRPINVGEEIFLDYGDLYWRLRGITPKDT